MNNGSLCIEGKSNSSEVGYTLDQQRNLPKGNRISFINDQQFIWVTQNQEINDILVFQQDWTIFQQNKNLTIHLKRTDCEDQYYFPIIYNKNRNILLIKHKDHLYLIRKLGNGYFIILSYIDCGTQYIYGAMRNDGQYLAILDYRLKKYSTYQILGKEINQ